MIFKKVDDTPLSFSVRLSNILTEHHSDDFTLGVLDRDYSREDNHLKIDILKLVREFDQLGDFALIAKQSLLRPGAETDLEKNPTIDTLIMREIGYGGNVIEVVFSSRLPDTTDDGRVVDYGQNLLARLSPPLYNSVRILDLPKIELTEEGHKVYNYFLESLIPPKDDVGLLLKSDYTVDSTNKKMDLDIISGDLRIGITAERRTTKGMYVPYGCLHYVIKTIQVQVVGQELSSFGMTRNLGIAVDLYVMPNIQLAAPDTSGVFKKAPDPQYEYLKKHLGREILKTLHVLQTALNTTALYKIR